MTCRFALPVPLHLRLDLILRGLKGGVVSFKDIPRLLGEIGPAWGDLLSGLCRRLCDNLRRKTPPRSTDCCIRVPNTSYKRADPLIYSQQYLMKQGLAVTWNNPDIQLFKGGAPVDSNNLAPDTDYEVQVTVWNGSYDAPAIGLPVHLSYLSFGAGTTSTPVGTTYVNLGIKGSAQQPAIATLTWKTPKAAGHYCLQVRLEWADDANPDNNVGQENTNVGTAHSPAVFKFAVRNDAGSRRRFELEVDMYDLPASRTCTEEDKRPPRDDEERARRRNRPTPGRLSESRARWQRALATQGHGLSPVTADWAVKITPQAFVLGPDAETEVTVEIEPKDPGFHGTRPFNISVFAIDGNGNRQPEGGVTLTVVKA
jgi:hypothetical protein